MSYSKELMKQEEWMLGTKIKIRKTSYCRVEWGSIPLRRRSQTKPNPNVDVVHAATEFFRRHSQYCTSWLKLPQLIKMDNLREINSSDEQGGSRDGLFIRIIVLHIIVANAVEWDDRWFALADILEGLDLLQQSTLSYPWR